METKRCLGCMKLKKNSPICEHCAYDENQHNAAHQLPAGTVLKEQYLIGRVLGQGGFGITYLGWDLYLDIPVAIKEYFPSGLVMRENTLSNEVASLSGDAGARFANNKERFFREAKMLARFAQMPEIVQVKNFFLANNTAYIVMEYVEGITLKQHVKNMGGTLSPEETFCLLKPVIQALEKVHKSGLVHRDISPDNIMLMPDGGAKLLDFGAVRDVGAAVAGQGLTSSTEAILKPGYAPIEQYQKRGSLGPWTDVYALCGTIYFCLTGNAPVDAPERVMDDPELHLQTLLPDLPEHCRTALEQGMALRAEDRIATMAELDKALFREKENAAAPVVTASVQAPAKKTQHNTAKAVPVKKARKQKKTRKSGLSLLIAACAAVAVAVLLLPKVLPEEETIPQTTAAEDIPSSICGDDLTWSLEGETLTIEGSGEMWDFSAETAPWQEYASEITRVKVSGSVTKIGNGAFMNMSTLNSAKLPESLTIIGEDAFRGTALSEIVIPDSVIEIASRAFMNTPLQQVELGTGLEIIGTRAFALCPQLETVEFASNPMLLEHWSERIFTADDQKNIPQNLTILAQYGSYAWAYAAHYGIDYTSNGTLPIVSGGACGQRMTWNLYEGGVFVLEGSGNMTEFADGLHWDATAEEIRRASPWANVAEEIRLLYIGDEIASIANRAFYGCESLQYLYYDGAANNIGSYAGHGFFGYNALAYTGLIQLEMPDFCEMPNSLEGCKDLVYVKTGYLPYGGQMGSGYFEGCASLQVLDVNWSTDAVNWTEESNLFDKDGQDVLLPAFPSISGRPDSELERLCRQYNIPFTPSINGFTPDITGKCGEHVNWFLDREQKTLVLYGDYEAVHDSNIKADTWDFRDQRPEFYAYKDEIEHIFVTSEVTALGSCIFQNLTSLKSIDTLSNTRNGYEGGRLDAGDYSRISRIGDRAFAGCHALEYMDIPTGVTNLGTELFLDCTSMKEVYFWTGSKQLRAGTLAGCYSLNVLHCGPFSSFSEDVFKAYSREDDGHDYTLHVVVYCYGGGAQTQAKKMGLTYQMIE